MTQESYKVNNPIDTDPDPSPKPGARKLRRYWTRGPGAAKIRWGTANDFYRCVRQLRKYVSDPEGLCNVYHRVAVGAPPGQGHPGGKTLTWDMEYKKHYTSETLEKLGPKGQAFKNHNGEWSYPIVDAEDLKNAIRAFGRSAPQDRERLKAYIERRAKALGKTNLIPDGWHTKSLEDELSLVEIISYAESLKSMELSDIIKINEMINYEQEETKDDMPELEHKNLGVSGGITETTEDGIVEALVSVTGVVDNVNDIIEPGAYEKTLKERTAKGVWSHDWNTPVSKVVDIKELLPGDERLPSKLANGEPWPAEAGALYVKAKFNLETQRGREAFSDVKFFGDQTEWSIGYKVPPGASKKENGIRKIKELQLFEFSPVLFGAASNARSLISTAKSLFDSEEEFMAEVKSLVNEESSEPVEEPNTSTAEVPSEENPVVVEVEEPVVEDIRAQEKQIPLTAATLAELKALYDQLGTVLSLVSEVKVVEVKPEVKFAENKTLREAMDVVIDGAYDSGVVEAIDNSIIALEGAIKAMDEKAIRDNANDALDEITLALQDERADEQTKSDLKALVAAIGEALKQAETPNVPNTEEEIVEEPKRITISAEEWKSLLSS